MIQSFAFQLPMTSGLVGTHLMVEEVGRRDFHNRVGKQSVELLLTLILSCPRMTKCTPFYCTAQDGSSQFARTGLQ